VEEVIKKLKFKSVGVVINAPSAMKKEFVALGFSVLSEPEEGTANTILFVNNNAEFLYFSNNWLNHIVPDSVCWIAYPKGSSKIKTDINRDTLRITAEGYGITTVSAISIDDTWSALRFRPIDKVGK